MNPIARVASLLFFVLGAGAAAHAVTIITTMPNTSTWVTFYQAGVGVGSKANAGCITGGKGSLQEQIFGTGAFSSGDYYVRTEVMASHDCKGTKICDTRMRASRRTPTLYVNQSAGDPNNCFISEKDQSDETRVGPAVAACTASLAASASQVDAAFAKARAANQIDAAEAARYRSARANTGNSLQAMLRVGTLGKCRSDLADLDKVRRVVSSMGTPLPGPAIHSRVMYYGGGPSECERGARLADDQLTRSHLAASSERRLGRIGEAEFAALRAQLETVWKDRVAKHGGSSEFYACQERMSLIGDLQSRLRTLAY